MAETQQQQIAEAERIAEYYDRTGDALGFVTQAQSLLNREVRLLDPSKVEELERAVAAARSEMDAARQSSADLVRELEDDLLRLQGRTEEIEQRRQQLKREEIRLQLRSNEIDDETRRNLEQALRLMEQKAQLQRDQAAEAARSAGDNEKAAQAAEREADAYERAADAAERTSRSRTSAVGDGRLQIEITTRASENGAPNFSQSDLAQLATRLTPLIVQEIRNDQGLGL
jgi:TolA-binding protein